MVEPVEHAIQRAYTYYLALFVILVFASVLCFVVSKRKVNMAIYGAVLVAVAVITFVTSFLPFAADCANSNISIVDCVYINPVGNTSKTTSSIFGIYSVKLLTSQETINVSTVPLSNSIFPVGEYSVRAYYTTYSKRLIYIEMLS